MPSTVIQIKALEARYTQLNLIFDDETRFLQDFLHNLLHDFLHDTQYLIGYSAVIFTNVYTYNFDL